MKMHIKATDSAKMRAILHPRSPFAHKGTMGHALLIGGSHGMAGSVVLASEACLRSGIGKLSLLTTVENRVIIQTTVPEAILAEQEDTTKEYNAVGIGPGMGLDAALIESLLDQQHAPMVLDADALNTMSWDKRLVQMLHPNSILTPHPKEAERLIGSSQVDDVAQWAQEHGVYVVLKGHPTHLLTPEGDNYELEVGNSGMATAGSGDVLTGLLTGLLAQGYTPLEAALLGVWLHGKAGDFAAIELTEHCMLARDIVRHLPQAFRTLTEGTEEMPTNSTQPRT